MTAERLLQVFGLGQCSLDHIGRIGRYPQPDEKCELVETLTQGGGPTATAMVALARWGIRCHLAGVVGDDLFGGLIASSLAAEGVDATGLVVRPGCSSQFAFIAAEPASARRTIFWQRPTGAPLGPEEIDIAKLRRARVFYTDGLSIEAALAAAAVARKAGVTIVVDGGTLRDGMVELARRSDCFIVSEVFARALLGGENDPRAACRLLAGFGPRVVGVTLGRAGHVALAAGRWIEQPAYRVAAIDTTGCGDVFHAGFVYGLLNGWETARSLDLGSWAAARVSLRLGGRSGIPTGEELAAWNGATPAGAKRGPAPG